MRRLVVIGFVLAIVTPLAAVAVLQPQMTQSQFVAYSNFQAIASGVYVEPGMTRAEIQAFLAQLEDSKERVAELFGGGLVATPTIIAGEDEVAMASYLSNRAGSTHATPFSSHVVIGPDGLNVDVIAHELAHAEHHARVGYLAYWWKTPMWFIEGLAMQVDQREKYDEAAWQRMTDGGAMAPELATMQTGGGFGVGNLTANYATAKHEVARWISESGRATLPRFFARMRDGADFDVAYGVRETP